jgi:hypothetical protein
MSNSWKQYGGTKNLSKDNNITTHTLVCDNFVLRSAYVGTFTIDGGLVVSDVAKFGKDVDISGNLIASKLNISSGFILNDLSINGNLEVLQNTTLQQNVNIYDTLSFGQGGNSYLFGNQTQELLGLNTPTPQATLDIVGNTSEVLNVYSNQPTNRNIIARNQNNHGIVVQTSDISSSLQFYNDTTINPTTSTRPDAQLQYIQGGILELDASNTQLFSQMSISPLTGQNAHLKNETAIIYDISNGKYLYDVYKQDTENTGNALTLVATDMSSITFLNIITPNKKGLEIGGGAYPNDQSRSLGTFGYNDSTGNYVPIQNLVSGSSSVKVRSTTGINTFAPRTDAYSLDINGPVHITNGQITPVIDTSFQIIDTHFSSSIGMSVGTPSAIARPYFQNILYTSNGGQSWKIANINSGDLQDAPILFTAVYVFNATYAFVGGTQGFFFYTNNGGSTWNVITIVNLTAISSLYVIPSPSVAGLRTYYTTNPITGPTINYIDSLFTDLNGATLTPTPVKLVDATFKTVNYINGDGTFIYVTGTNTSNNDAIAKYSLNLTTPVYTSPNAVYNFNAINVFNSSIVIAVGTGSIYWTNNGGTSWTNNTSIASTLNSVFVLDTLRAVAVGNGGTLIYTNDGYNTWQPIPTEILNASGNANDVTSYNLISISMTDINTLLITGTIQTFVNGSQWGYSREYYLYLPNLFNTANNSVLDISGAVYISGDLHVNDGGSILSNNQTFSLLNTNVETIYFGGNATSLSIGTPIVGNTTIHHNLVVAGLTTTTDMSLNSGNIYVNNNININNGTTGQQANDIAIGINAGKISQQSGAVAVGTSAGMYSQGSNAIALGTQAGQTGQGTNTIAVGTLAGQNAQSSGGIAIGIQAGQTGQGTNTIAVGTLAGQNVQSSGGIAIGFHAGQTGQGTNAVALGSNAGQNAQSSGAIAIGIQAGQTGQGNNAIAVGALAGQMVQSSGGIAIGFHAGQTGQGPNAIAIGTQAGQNSQNSGSIGIGFQAGQNSQQPGAVAIGTQAGQTFQGLNTVAIGTQAGQTGQGATSVAIGNQAGQNQQGFGSVAIGEAGTNEQGQNSVSIGFWAGLNQQASGTVAIGYYAGQFSQGANAIAIGNSAGVSQQSAGSIVLNAGGNILNAGNTGFFVNPIRKTTPIAGSNVLAYDYSGSNEIISISNLSLDANGNVDITGNLSVSKQVLTNNINPVGNTITIGAGVSNVINIGNFGNPSSAFSDVINIGGIYDIISLNGNVTSTSVNNLTVKNKTITLNSGSITNNSSAGSGITINDNNNVNAGYFLVDLSLNGYVFKAPNSTQTNVTNGNINNIVDLNINSLITPTGLNSAIIMLQPSGTSHIDSSYVINVSSVDISNILLRNATLSTITNQVITTALAVGGDLSANNIHEYGALTLPDNSVMISNTPSLDYTTFLQTFYGSNVSTSATYISCSANGQYQTAVVGTTAIYTSNNYGLTWVNVGLASDTFTSVSVSASGQIQIATSTTGHYHSTTYGVGWSKTTSPTLGVTSCLSASGKYQYLSSSTQFYASVNQGVSFTNTFTSSPITNIGCSASGQYVILVTQSDVYLSTDYGISFTSVFSSTGLTPLVSISASGQYQTVVFSNAFLYVYSSSNYGVSWNNTYTGGVGKVSTSLQMSSSGQYQVFNSVTDQFILVSTDFGQTFARAVNAPLHLWSSACLSSNGEYMSATSSAGIYFTKVSLPNANFTSGNAINFGYQSGMTSQGINTTAIGYQAGQINQQSGAVAIGFQAGQIIQQLGAVAIGNQAGQTGQGLNAISMGNLAGQLTQQSQGIAIGYQAGRNMQQNDAVAIGTSAGQTNQQSQSIALGNFAGSVSQQMQSISIGSFAGQLNQQSQSIAMGNFAGQQNQGANGVSIGTLSGQVNQGSGSVAIGFQAGVLNQQVNAIAMGQYAGNQSQQSNAIAIGTNAGNTNQGASSIAIGQNAGTTNQNANSIAINASGSNLNTTASGLFINPIRKANLNGANLLAYDFSSSNEVIDVSNLTIDTGGNLTVSANTIMLGNVAIGIPAPFNTYTLDISGTARATSFNATSDYRIKANIQNLNETFSVDHLRPIYYFNKEANKEDIGFIAHEVQQHYPYLVTGNKDGDEKQSLNYNGIMGILVKEVKECKTEIKRLKEEMTKVLREQKIRKTKEEIEKLQLANEKILR